MTGRGDASTQRPNILIVCTDQQRYDTIGRLGHRAIETPALDRLVDEGVTFERAYTASPVCAPSRASMMTGRYPSGHGLWANGVTLPPQPVFPRILADAGYRTGLVGKLHLTSAWDGAGDRPVDDGFEVYRWAHDPGHPSPENDYHHWLRENFPQLAADAASVPKGTLSDGESGGYDVLPTEAHYSRWASTRAVEFLESHDPADGPFLLWVNYFDPHHPFVAPQEYLDRYRIDDMPLGIDAEEPPELPAAVAGMRTYANAAGARAFDDYTPDELREIVRAYYAMVTLVDDEIGRVLAHLDTAGLREDTLVVFTSDHGELLTDHGLLLKGPALYEASVRVPLVLRWPARLPAGQRRRSLVSLVDVAATALAAAGCVDISWQHGVSLLDVARDGDQTWTRDWALCQYRDSGRPDDPPVFATMLRQGDRKLVAYHGSPATTRPDELLLFDLDDDLDERVNLADDPSRRSDLTELLVRLLDVGVWIEDRSAPRVAPW